MLSKYLAPSLAAAVVLAGLTAAPAQAATGTDLSISSPTSTSTEAPSSAPTNSVAATPTPTATQSVAPKATPTAEPTKPPLITTLKDGTQYTEPPVAPSPTATVAPKPVALQTTVSTGSLQGKKLSYTKRSSPLLEGKVSADAYGSMRPFRIESYNAKTKKWSTLTSGNTNYSGVWRAYIGSTTADGQTLRLVVPGADKSFKAYTGPATSVVRTKQSITLYTYSNPKTIHSVPWQQKYFKFSLSQAPDKVQVQLHKRVGNKWAYVSKLYTNSKTYSYQFKLPKGGSKSKDGTVAYRVALSASTYYNGAASSATNVRWENPRNYKGTQRTVYNYMASKCPAILVRMDGNLAKKGAWGQAHLGNDPAYISIYSRVPAKHLKTVALHECSHFYQWNAATNKNNRGWDAYKAAANKLMGTKGDTGFERVNECMSASWGGHSYWTYGASAKLCGKPAVKSFVQKSLKGQKVT